MSFDLSLNVAKVFFRNPTTVKEEKWCEKCGKMTEHVSLSMVDHQNLLNEQAGMKRCGILERFFYNIGDRLQITW
jgi:BarA-like signal transduction histidine kinase